MNGNINNLLFFVISLFVLYWALLQFIFLLLTFIKKQFSIKSYNKAKLNFLASFSTLCLCFNILYAAVNSIENCFKNILVYLGVFFYNLSNYFFNKFNNLLQLSITCYYSFMNLTFLIDKLTSRYCHMLF